jgi:hypothetical protein
MEGAPVKAMLAEVIPNTSAIKTPARGLSRICRFLLLYEPQIMMPLPIALVGKITYILTYGHFTKRTQS